MRTQVGIVGAGPAGLLLARMLDRAGIDNVVLERRDRAYVEQRVRAGVLEQGTVDLLAELGVDERLRREGLVHHGIELRFEGQGHRIAMSDLTGGRAIAVYGQQEVVKDLIAARLADGGEISFEVDDVALDGIDGDRPTIRYRHAGRAIELQCDLIAGCDGFHGVSRQTIPAQALRIYEREHPFGWLGVLAAVAPSTEELIYAYHARGFAMHSLRSPQLSRLYLQCDPDERIEAWPDERIWEELHLRLASDDGWTLREGPIVEKGITAMRSFVCEPMRHGRLFLAGDAAHIVPPTGAKGLNLAAHDVRVLAEAIVAWAENGSEALLDAYSETCLRRVWRVQEFSTWMTTMFHRCDGDDGFDERLQLARLRAVTQSQAAARALAENYVGLEHV